MSRNGLYHPKIVFQIEKDECREVPNRVKTKRLNFGMIAEFSHETKPISKRLAVMLTRECGFFQAWEYV